jgi:hypothetical protein
MEKSTRAYSNVIGGLYPARRKKQANLHAISLLGVRVRQHVPLLMAARQHPDAVVDILAEAAERMVVVYTLSGAQWNEIESVIPLWSRLIRSASTEASMKRFVAEQMNPKVAEHLSTASANLDTLGQLGDTQRYVLARLTQYVEDETGQGGSLDRYFDGRNVTIEHILAQSPTGESLDPFAAVPPEDLLPNYIYALGNLCLLNRVSNSMVGNRPYSQKAPIYKKFGQFMLTRAISSSISGGKDTKFSRMAKRLKTFKSWSPASIQARTRILHDLADDLWDLQG